MRKRGRFCEGKRPKDMTEKEYRHYNNMSQKRHYYRHKNPFYNIFIVRNVKTGEVYIGKTTNKIQKRWYQLCAEAKAGGDSALLRSIRQYGQSAFELQTLYECSPIDNPNKKLQEFKEEITCVLNEL